METINFKDIIDKAMKQIGQVNIVVTGKTGVGKSTLVNAVFNEDIAETGIGKPCTQHTKEYIREGSPLHLFDTKGFELKEFQIIQNEILNLIRARRSANPSEHIHMMWYCISSEGHKIESSEEEFIKELSREIPTIVVITQTHTEAGMKLKNFVGDVFRDTNVQVLDVLALPIKIDDSYTKKAYNVDTLVSKTYEMLPEAAKNAFAAAQKVNKEIRKKSVEKIIAAAATAAAGVGAAPIPFSDAVGLAPIQIGMLAGISRTMGLEITSGFLSTMVASAAGVIGGTYAGRAIVSGILKFIPGAGTILGGVISAATASTLTIAMGWAYFEALCKLLYSGSEMTAAALSAEFVNMLKVRRLSNK